MVTDAVNALMPLCPYALMPRRGIMGIMGIMGIRAKGDNLVLFLFCIRKNNNKHGHDNLVLVLVFTYTKQEQACDKGNNTQREEGYRS